MIGQQLLSLLYGDPADQIHSALAGPNPNPGAASPPTGAPGAAPGGPSQLPGAGGSQPQPQPPMAPANATQSPPDLAALYMKLHEQDQAANQIDRGTALMASAFGTAAQQHDMMNYAQGIKPDERALVVGQGIEDQAKQTAQNEHARFMAGAAGMATLLGVTPQQAAWLSNDKQALDEVLRTDFEGMAPTEAMKNVDAATKAYQAANPNATPEEVAQFKASTMTGLIPGPAQRAAETQAVELQKFKDNAMEDYQKSTQKIDETEKTIDQLLKIRTPPSKRSPPRCRRLEPPAPGITF